MITLLTSELNRINQGCKKWVEWEENDGDRSWKEFGTCGEGLLCPTCQKEKETLKKVSLMWADEMIRRICSWTIRGDYPENHKTVDDIVKLREECEQIKSQMEKA